MPHDEISRLLRNSDDAGRDPRLLALVYEQLHAIAQQRMAGERHDHTLQATALVHEAYLRLIGDQKFDGSGHFFAAAAEAMAERL